MHIASTPQEVRIRCRPRTCPAAASSCRVADGSLTHSTGTSKNSITSSRNSQAGASAWFTWQNTERQVSTQTYHLGDDNHGSSQYRIEVKYAIKAIQKKRVKDYLTFQNEIKLLRVLVRSFIFVNGN